MNECLHACIHVVCKIVQVICMQYAITISHSSSNHHNFFLEEVGWGRRRNGKPGKSRLSAIPTFWITFVSGKSAQVSYFEMLFIVGRGFAPSQTTVLRQISTSPPPLLSPLPLLLLELLILVLSCSPHRKKIPRCMCMRLTCMIFTFSYIWQTQKVQMDVFVDMGEGSHRGAPRPVTSQTEIKRKQPYFFLTRHPCVSMYVTLLAYIEGKG